MTAQVLVVDGPGRVRFVSDEPPGPLPDSGFDVRTRFSGLSAGTDLSWVKGTNPMLSSAWDAELGLFDDTRPGAGYPVRKVGYKRIATEEAWGPSELLGTYRKMAASKSIDDPGFVALWTRLGTNAQLMSRLANIGEGRIRDMDATGIEMQVLSLTSPGVQVFDAATANKIASDTNDQVAETIRKYPTRFAGLAAAAPQDPKAAAKEIERGVRKLGLKGVIINSHTRGEFLDDPKFWEIFEAAEALNVPIYLHPQAPPPSMIVLSGPASLSRVRRPLSSMFRLST